MNRLNTFIIIVLLLFSSIPLYANNSITKSFIDDDLEIVLINTELSKTNVKFNYEIRNKSKQNVWILKGIGEYGSGFSPTIDEKEQTLILRMHSKLPIQVLGDQVYDRYNILYAGQKQTESVCIPIPLIASLGFNNFENGVQGLVKRVIIEIGIYVDDLPIIVNEILENAVRIRQNININNPEKEYITSIEKFFGGFLVFNELNEGLLSREEEILIPYTHGDFKGEHFLQLVIEDVNILYKEYVWSMHEPSPPDLTLSTKIDIHYEPSLLEYFFPHKFQQSIINDDEINYLKSVQNIVLEDQDNIQAFNNDINKALLTDGIARQLSSANIVCYQGEKLLSTFDIYNNDILVTEDMNYFIRLSSFKSLYTITPVIQPIDIRIRCATNLKNLWYRLRLYQRAIDDTEKLSSNKIMYPPANKWCDAMESAYTRQRRKEYRRWNIKQLLCPGFNEGKCTYAMNPNCKPESPDDMVLLFETKDGWNQHGGPELFTFDNHDPKGGCVLLNDGTVEFIRTEEELNSLRWK